MKLKPYQAWLVLLVGMAFYAYEYILRVIPGTMIEDIGEFSQLTSTHLSQFSFYYYIGYTLMQIPVGILLDSVDKRKIMVMACLLCAVGNFFFLNLDHMALAYFGRLLIGIGSSFALVGVLQVANHYFPRNYFPVIAGVTFSLAMLAGLLGDKMLIVFFTSMGFKETIKLFIITGLILAMIFYFVTPKMIQPDPTTLADKLKALKNLCMKPMLAANGVAGGLLYLPLTLFAELWGIHFLHYHNHFSIHQATNLNTLLFLGWGTGTLLHGWIVKKTNHLFATLRSASLISSMLVLAIIFSGQLPAMIIGTMIFLFGLFSSSQTLVLTIARDISPKGLEASTLGITNSLIMLTTSLLILFAKQLGDVQLSMVHLDPDQFHLILIPIATLTAIRLSSLGRKKAIYAVSNSSAPL